MLCSIIILCYDPIDDIKSYVSFMSDILMLILICVYILSSSQSKVSWDTLPSGQIVHF